MSWRIGRVLAVAVALFVLVAATPSPAGADSIGDKRAEAAQIASQLAELQRQEGVLAERYNTAVERLGTLQSKVDDSRARLDAANHTIGQRRHEVGRLAIKEYTQGGSSSTQLPLLLNSTADKLGQRRAYTVATIGNREAVLNGLRVARDDGERQSRAFDSAVAKADQAKKEMESEREANRQALAQEKALNDRVQGELAQLVAQEQARQVAEQQRRAEEKARQDAEAARASAPPPAPVGNPQTAPPDAPTPTTPQAKVVTPPTPAATRGAPAAPPTTAAAPTPTTAAPDLEPRTTTTTAAPTPTTAAAAPAPADPVPPAPSSPRPAPPAPSSNASGIRAQIVSLVESQVGVPYVFGGSSPSGFDCSGLVQWAYAQSGMSVPRGATDQLHATRRIPLAELQPGDLVFYNGNDSLMGHVAVYVGNGQVVQALHSGAPVKYDSLYFWDALVGAGTFF